MSNLPGHIELYNQRQYQLTIDKAAAMKDKEKPRHGRGRPHLILIDEHNADQEVSAAVSNSGSNYDD